MLYLILIWLQACTNKLFHRFGDDVSFQALLHFEVSIALRHLT